MLVQDNLNTHKPASLYEAFPPAEARRLVARFERHCSQKHGGWLNIAESELGVLSSQCLDRRIPDHEIVNEIAAFEKDRNKRHAKPIGNSPPPTLASSPKYLYPTFWLTRATSVQTQLVLELIQNQ